MPFFLLVFTLLAIGFVGGYFFEWLMIEIKTEEMEQHIDSALDLTK